MGMIATTPTRARPPDVDSPDGQPKKRACERLPAETGALRAKSVGDGLVNNLWQRRLRRSSRTLPKGLLYSTDLRKPGGRDRCLRDHRVISAQPPDRAG